MLHNRYYYAARAAEQRSHANASINPKVRAIHLDMAARYDALIEANTEGSPAAEPLNEAGPRILSTVGRTR